ncbi:MAG: hypothetical protein COV67_00895 [Nitrospinae bacterium CG11_big_fil_rev_8_21_14_0_20_56_8]|nr:MAG: hypothetical protein COV67_00895 [Nitrospinae bacterium CG11_big_fil_rev_8_21_14_0_20_56_8]
MNFKYGKGTFLIANPVLPDPNFSRTVVLLCNHDEQGSFGLVVNRSANLKASDVFANLEFPRIQQNGVFIGGPVSQSQVFYLARSPEPIAELEQICAGLYLGMSMEALELVCDRLENPGRDLRFYLGYSGWGAGQLAGEMEHKSWLTCNATPDIVFEPQENKIWAQTVLSLGKEFEYLVNAPVDPQWN